LLHRARLQSLRAFFFVQRSTDAEARTLVNACAAQAAVPAKPTLRSNSRRETRSGSTVHLRFVWMARSRYVRAGRSATALDRPGAHDAPIAGMYSRIDGRSWSDKDRAQFAADLSAVVKANQTTFAGG
jgi:hypothetical protein